MTVHHPNIINLYAIIIGMILIGWIIGGAIARFTTNDAALLTSDMANCALPIITYIASPVFRRSQSQKQRHSG